MKSLALLSVLFVVAHGFDLSKVIPDNRAMPPRGKYLGKGRIIGGEVVTPHSIPYQASLYSVRADGTYFCGGSILSPNYVLTAAHCVHEVFSISVILGEHNREVLEENEIGFVTYLFGAHAEYNPQTLSNDIAWVKFRESIEFTNAIQPTTLPSRADVGRYDGEVGRISGWGYISTTEPGITNLLRSTEADVIEWEACAPSYLEGLVTEKHVCTDALSGHASCSGDSGGPLVINGVQVGIVSFGSQAGCTVAPSAFVRIHSYLDWIEENTDAVIN